LATKIAGKFTSSAQFALFIQANPCPTNSSHPHCNNIPNMSTNTPQNYDISFVRTGPCAMRMASKSTPTDAILSILHRPTPTAPSPLPPDVATARKTRINQEMIKIFKRPCPPNTTPSVQGIGLYTHVAGPPLPPPQYPHERFRKSNPTFLPIRGAKRHGGLQPLISDEVKAVADKVRALVNEEEKRVGHVDMDVKQLRERYGAVDAPEGRRSMDKQTPGYAMMTSGAGLDVAKAGAGEERRGSASVVKSGSVYDAERDPRRRIR
jgi:hypothetical protein